MMKEQDGKCAGCLRTCLTGRSLAVDHDHKMGLVRGLLCFKCNTILGKASDDPVLLTRLATYVMETGQ